MSAEPWKLTREMFLDEDEVDSLLDFVAHRRAESPEKSVAAAGTDELLIQCLVYSGLRNSEFCGLQIKNAVFRGTKSLFQVRGTQRQDRDVHVPCFLGTTIADYVKEIRPLLGAPKSEKALALNDRGRPFDRNSLYRRVVRILKAAGLESRASVQLLRHTYGYLGYKRSGGNLLFLKQQLGHAHPMVTSVYAEFVEEDYSQLANRVGGAAD